MVSVPCLLPRLSFEVESYGTVSTFDLEVRNIATTAIVTFMIYLRLGGTHMGTALLRVLH